MVFQIDTGLKAAHQGIGGQIRSNLYNSSRPGAVAAFRGIWRLHTIARAGDDLQAFMPCSQVFEKGVLNEIESQVWEGVFKKSDISYMTHEPRLEATVLLGCAYYIER